MYISDKRTANTLAVFVLVIGPWLGVSMQAWGWLLDMVMLLAILCVGRNAGAQALRYGTVFLASGYALALIYSNGLSSIEYFSFVPWAGLVTLWGLKTKREQKVIVFWSLVAAVILAVLPSASMLWQEVPQESVQTFVQATLEQYRQTGMMDSLVSQGLTESQLEALFSQIATTILTITPGLIGISALAKWGIVYYFMMRYWPFEGLTYRPFTEWRLPWYAVWGMNFALASYLIGDQIQWLALKNIGLNLMIVYAVVALVLGSSLFINFLRLPWLSGFFRFIIIFASVFYAQLTALVLVIVGLLDLVLDFRHRRLQKKE